MTVSFSPVSIAPPVGKPIKGPDGIRTEVGGNGSPVFGNLLSSGWIVSNMPTPADLIEETPFYFGGTNSQFDPAMLVLQQNPNMTAEELQALLSGGNNTSDVLKHADILRALTPGIPHAEIPGGGKTIIPPLPPELELPEGRFPPIGILPQHPRSLLPVPIESVSNPLLSASGIAITDMDKLKLAISNATLESQDAAAQIAADQKTVDAEEASQAGLALVMIVSNWPQPANQLEDGEFDFTSFSGLTKGISLTPPANDSDWIERQLKNKENFLGTNTDLTPDALAEDGLYALNDSTTDLKGFKGSLASLDKTLSGDGASIANTTSGDMTSNVSQFAISFASSNSVSTDSTLLSPNGQLLQNTHGHPLTNHILSSPTATGSHPTTQAIAVMLEKAAGSEKAKQELSVQLDPPELGRLQIQLSMEKGEAMKVRLVAEKQETLSLLQRDSHVLKAALDSAGIQTDNSSLSFDLGSNDQSFNQLMGGQNNDHQGANKNNDARFLIESDGTIKNAAEIRVMETRMDFITNQMTGNIHYSLMV